MKYAIKVLKIQIHILENNNWNLEHNYPDPVEFSNVLPVVQKNEELIKELKDAIRILEKNAVEDKNKRGKGR